MADRPSVRVRVRARSEECGACVAAGVLTPHRLHGDLKNVTRPGDVVIAPDIRSDACGPWLVERRVTLYTYLLSINLLPQLLRAAARHPQHCRFLSHSHWLANYSHTVAIPAALVVRPYISPSYVALCAQVRAHRAQQPPGAPQQDWRLAGPFSPSPAGDAAAAERLGPAQTSAEQGDGEGGAAAGGSGPHLGAMGAGATRPLVLLDSDAPGEVRFHVAKACNVSGCEAVRVLRLPRSRVKALLHRASVVVDWCMVGTERLPVEAVLCGAVLLTGRCRRGGGAYVADFPLPPQNVLSSPSELPGAIARVLDGGAAEARAQAQMVALYEEHTTPTTMATEAAAAVEHILRQAERTALDGQSAAAADAQRQAATADALQGAAADAVGTPLAPAHAGDEHAHAGDEHAHAGDEHAHDANPAGRGTNWGGGPVSQRAPHTGRGTGRQLVGRSVQESAQAERGSTTNERGGAARERTPRPPRATVPRTVRGDGRTPPPAAASFAAALPSTSAWPSWVEGGIRSFCARWQPRPGAPTSQPVSFEPTACYLYRNRRVTRVELSVALRADGSVAYARDATVEFERWARTAVSHPVAASIDGALPPPTAVERDGSKRGDAEIESRESTRAHRSRGRGLVGGYAGGLFAYVSHRHTREYEQAARMLHLSADHPLVHGSSLLMYVNNAGLGLEMLTRYLRRFPQRGIRMLARTAQNAGYRCGHVHAFALSTHIWARYEWVISLSGADVLLAPPAILQLATALTAPEQPRATFVIDVFHRYRFRYSVCMDAFAFRTTPLGASRAWETVSAQARTPPHPPCLQCTRARARAHARTVCTHLTRRVQGTRLRSSRGIAHDAYDRTHSDTRPRAHSMHSTARKQDAFITHSHHIY